MGHARGKPKRRQVWARAPQSRPRHPNKAAETLIPPQITQSRIRIASSLAEQDPPRRQAGIRRPRQLRAPHRRRQLGHRSDLIQSVERMQRAYRQIGLGSLDQHREFDL
jgi:hypothetical protein